MREGKNPVRDNLRLSGYQLHRIIIPVYIPTLDGYFKHALKVLNLCLESLRITASGKASITIISNNSAQTVIEELSRYYEEGWIDQLLLNRCNRGKIDAVVSAARSAFEPLITISDCDVLFKSGWLEAVERIFLRFPECGIASPLPNPSVTWYHTSATILGGLARGELRFANVVPDEDLNRFAESIGRPDLLAPEHKKSQLVLRRGESEVCVGGGHFACTLRKEVVLAMPNYPSLSAIDGNSEETWIDKPPDRLGLWRLATTRGYVYHMGNAPEPWMYEELEKCRNGAPHAPASPDVLPDIRLPLASRLPWRSRSLIVGIMKRFRFLRAIPGGRN